MVLKRSRQPMPDLVREELKARDLTAAYDARPAYQRNDYLWWINDAKREETKRKRLAKMMAELEAGHGYMGMDWPPSDGVE